MRTRFLLSAVPACLLLLNAGSALAQTDEGRLYAAPGEASPMAARVEKAAHEAESDPKLAKYTHQQRKDLVQFVSANLLFALAHEVGHAAVSEMGLPVLGREEDAADSFAVMYMLWRGNNFTHDVLVQTAKSWFLADERAQTEGIKAAFYDEHGMDKQRAYQIVCLMVGSDPDRYSDLADSVGMPDERQATCGGDYSNAKWSWETSLKPHLRAPDQPKQKIDAVYGPGKGMFDGIAERNHTIRLLETVAQVNADRYVWRAPFTLEMQTCGIQNAHWDLAAHKITICYEIAADFVSLYEDYVLRKEPIKTVAHARRDEPCPAGQIDVAAADAIRYYSGGEH